MKFSLTGKSFQCHGNLWSFQVFPSSTGLGWGWVVCWAVVTDARVCTMHNKASGADGIRAELFQILKMMLLSAALNMSVNLEIFTPLFPYLSIENMH